MKCGEPFISIIMPVYNTEKFIEGAILSVLKQRYKNFQFIIVNDGSTDGSSAVCKKYRNMDERIYYVESSNKGASYARNLGLQYVKSEWVTFIDSDDLWDETFLQEMVDKICITPKGDFFYCGYKEIDVNGELLRISTGGGEGKFDSFIHKSGELRFPFNMDSFLVRTALLRSNKIYFDEGYVISEDIGFFLKILSITSAYCIPKILSSYVRHDNSATTKKWDAKVWKSTILIFNDAEHYCKKYSPELYNKFLLIKTFRIYRYIVSLIKFKCFDYALSCINEYRNDLNWFSENGSYFRDRLRAKIFLSGKIWAIRIIC